MEAKNPIVPRTVVYSLGIAVGLHLLMIPWTSVFMRNSELQLAYGLIFLCISLTLNLWLSTANRSLVFALGSGAVIGLVASFIALVLCRFLAPHGAQQVRNAVNLFGTETLLAVDLLVSFLLAGWLLSALLAMWLHIARGKS
jgi:hypothetical protein